MNVDKETAHYIMNYFPNLMTSEERMAVKHTTSMHKLGNAISDNTNLTRIYKERGWLTSDQSVLDLLKDGYDNFVLRVANRVMEQEPHKVFLNTCSKCHQLARTPYARQCRYCTHSWHSVIVGQFKLDSSFQLSGSCFFLLGEVVKGEIRKGHVMDLTILGLNKKPKIEAIEFARRNENGKVIEHVGLGTNDLSEGNKEYLKNIGSFGTPFDILREG